VFALVTRALSGLTASALITVTIYYLFQVFPPQLRPVALVVGIGLTQLGTPLARLFPVEMLAQHHWRNLHLIELAIPLAVLATMQALPLPPSDRSKVFERRDFLTIGLLMPAMLLIAIVLSEGRLYWWTDAPWIGWTLAAAVPLFAAAIINERTRSQPLLYVEWMGSAGILRFAAVALLVRIALAEQTFGSVGLLAASGLNNEQLRILFAIVSGAMLIGLATVALTLQPQRVRQLVIVAALIIALGAWLDSHATNQTRPQELYLSQALLGLGTTLFIGPALAFGFLRMLERGAAYFVSLVVLFSSTQNIGGLLAACAGPRPDAPLDAAVVVPAGWRDANAAGGEVTAEWWRGFGDATLTKVVDSALAHSVDVAIAVARVEEARAQFGAARGQLLPSAEVFSAAKRERFLNAFGQPALQTAQRPELDISYDLDLFGRLRNASEAARAALLATQATQDNVKLAVASSAAAGYIGLRALDARLAVVRDTVDARAGSLKIAQRRAQSGYATRLELEQAEAELHATEQLIPALQLAIARQENGLSVLLGESPRSIERGVTLSNLTTPTVPMLLPSDLLRRRPDIAQAEQSIVAADRSLDAARASFLPSIRLGAAGGYVDSTLIGDPVGIFSVGGSILAPLFEGGRLRAQADAAAARRDQAAYLYRKVALNAFREVEDALAAVQRTSEQEAVLLQQRDALARALLQATNRYRAGYSSYLEQLDAQRGLLSADLSLVQASNDRLSATVSLFQALGGGWSASP